MPSLSWMKSHVEWAVSLLLFVVVPLLMVGIGMGVTHAWELYGDNEPPDIQAVGKGLGGGSAVPLPRLLVFGSNHKHRYACIGAVLMSKQVADGIRDKNGFWKHGHTYQVRNTHAG